MDHSAAVGAVRRLGEREWHRLDADASSRVSLEVHRRFLRRFVPRGARVLEVGAGPGRFTTELAARGARVVVTDLSPAQLAAHERRVRGTPAERCVLQRELLDVADTSRYADGEFDVVLAYGGTWRHHLPDVDGVGTDDLPHVRRDGDGCRMYRWSEVVALVDAAGGMLVDGCASNWASLGEPDSLERLAADRARWRRFLEHEVAACAEPGARDGGTHILFATRPA